MLRCTNYGIHTFFHASPAYCFLTTVYCVRLLHVLYCAWMRFGWEIIRRQSNVDSECISAALAYGIALPSGLSNAAHDHFQIPLCPIALRIQSSIRKQRWKSLRCLRSKSTDELSSEFVQVSATMLLNSVISSTYSVPSWCNKLITRCWMINRTVANKEIGGHRFARNEHE